MRILLADNETNVRFALRVLLEHQPGLSVIGEVDDATNLLAQVKSLQPDLVLIGCGTTGKKTIASLRQFYPYLKVIALSGRPEDRAHALASGADDFVSKIDPPEHLLAAISKLMDGCTCRRST